MDLFSSLNTIVELIKSFGFPLFVAIWALWKLDKSWGALDDIENTLERLELIMNKNTEIQYEIATSIKMQYTLLLSKNLGGGE